MPSSGAPDDVRIGDFSKPVAPPPKGKPADAPRSPTKEALDSAEAKLEEAVAQDEAAIKPMASYEEKLKEVGLSRDKAAEIIDAVLLKGFWSEEVKITSRIKARFRTRAARDTRRAHEILEAQRFTIDAHYNETLTRLLLAASLEQFGDDTFKHPSVRKSAEADIEKAFQERVNYIDGLPDPALRILFAKLFAFDRKVAVALEEGSIENF